MTTRRYNPRTVTTIIRSPFLFGSVLALVALLAAASMSAQPAASKQLIAHRGASGYAPEHTPAAYKLAMEQKADFVEPDLAVSKDNVLFCMHDDTLERTTNVAEVFPDRPSADYQTRQPGKHWLGNDFTMAEIKRLDAGKWFKPEFAGQRIQTFQEAIDLVRGKAGLVPRAEVAGALQIARRRSGEAVRRHHPQERPGEARLAEDHAGDHPVVRRVGDPARRGRSADRSRACS